jgi:hypothetical protein
MKRVETKIINMKREDVYKLIDGERDYQDKKWCSGLTESDGIHTSACDWLVYMHDYIQEAMHFVSRNGDPEARDFAMENIRKVTAMGVAAMEQIDTKPR